MPNRKSYANADWMRMRFSCSLDKHGNCEVETNINKPCTSTDFGLDPHFHYFYFMRDTWTHGSCYKSGPLGSNFHGFKIFQ